MLILIMVFVGCTYQEQEQEQQEQKEEKVVENKQPAQGGTLFLQAQRIDTLNPLFTESTSNAQVLQLIFDGLIAYDDAMDVVPVLAESWHVSEDGRTWVFNLREDIKWHDGTPFTANDVDFTFRLLRNRNVDSIYLRNIQYVSHFNVEDDYTFRVVLSQPYGSFMRMMDMPILPKHVYEDLDLEDIKKHVEPIGTGAFKFVSYTAFKEIALGANAQWWKGQRPYIDEIIVKIIPDNDTALNALQINEIQYVSTNVVDWEKYSGKNNLKTHEYLTHYYEFIGVNFNNPVLSDVAVRRAIAYALDRNKMVSEILLGHAVITDVPILPKTTLYDETANEYTYNMEKARQILAQAGWEDLNDEGVLYKQVEEGEALALSFEIVTNDNNPVREKAAEYIVQQLNAIGMNVTLKKVAWDEINNQIELNAFDAILTGYHLSPCADLSFAFHSGEIDRAANFTSYANIEMDELLYQTFIAKDENAQKEAYNNLQHFIARELPFISLYFRTSAVVYHDDIKGDIQPISTNIYHGIENWYIVEE